MLSLFFAQPVQSSMASMSSNAIPWPMFQQNPRHTGLSRFIVPSTPILKWRFNTGGAVVSSPSVAFGTVYAGSTDGFLHARNRQAHLTWEFATGGHLVSSRAIRPECAIYLMSSDHNL